MTVEYSHRGRQQHQYQPHNLEQQQQQQHEYEHHRQIIKTGTDLELEAIIGDARGQLERQKQKWRHQQQQQESVTKQQLNNQQRTNCQVVSTFGVMEILQQQKHLSNDPSKTNPNGIRSINNNNNNNNNNSTSNNNTIINNLSFEEEFPIPKTYPNNTIIVDLNKCHHNITNFWSSPQSATNKTLTAALSNFKNCWPLISGRRRYVFNNQEDEINRIAPIQQQPQQYQAKTTSTLTTQTSCQSTIPPTAPNHHHHQEQQQQDLKQTKVKHDSAIGKLTKNKKRRYKFYMPESLLRTNVKLRSDDYDKALCVLTNDVRYQLHLLLYRRVQTIWLLLSSLICLLIPLVLITSLEHLIIAGTALLWIGFQIIGYAITTQFRKKLDEMLEKSVAQVNTFFMDHNLLVGVINFGSLLSKAKLTIPMLYFDTSQCREQIESIISIDSRRNDADGNNNNNNILDYSKIDLPLIKPNVMALAQSQLAKKIVLRYSQRWISYFEKRKLMFTDDRVRPRHLSTGKCLCQFVEEHFKNVPKFDKSQLQSPQQRRQQEDQQHQSKLNSNIANSKPNLIFNGKQHKQLQQAEETSIKSELFCDRTKHQLVPTIPTLSGLVSLHGKQNNYLKIDITDGITPKSDQPEEAIGGLVEDDEEQYNMSKFTGTLTNFKNLQLSDGFYLNSWHQKLGDNVKLTIQTPPQNQLQQPQQSPRQLDSAEVSLDSISNSDDLVKKLRLLLELRKNDLPGLNHESLFSDVLYKAPEHFSSIMPVPKLESTNTSANNRNNYVDSSLLESGGKHQTNTKLTSTKEKLNSESGKKFYNQRERLFFFGTNGLKKNQQQDPTTRNHVLEIC